MIEVEIPGYGHLELEHLICDFSGTISVDGKLIPGLKERFRELAKHLHIHVITSDTHGGAEASLVNVDCDLVILQENDHDVQKESYLRNLNGTQVVAIGNGNNDARLLKSARLGICVCLEEGCSVAAMKAADILARSAEEALDLLLNPNRLKATLRY
ncbi:MAG: ATPase P [candidate division Zixibacteria bacterium]|nr:ATPase P [candidate division Zixibacteria bacterium]